MKQERATRDRGQTQPLPQARTKLELRRTYTPQEYEQIALGLIPEEMEDKWFIFLEDDCLHLHRSWTGFCTYEVQFAERDGQHEIVEAWVSRDPEQYRETDDAFDAAMLLFLIDRLLLGRGCDCPAIPGIAPDQQALAQWSQIGPGRARSESSLPGIRLIKSPEDDDSPDMGDR